MDVQSIKLTQRSVIGKKVRRLRREGWIPVHVYGNKQDAVALQAEAQVLRRILPQVGTNVPLSVEVEGAKGEDICFVREVQRHPVTEDVLHVDFLRVDVSQTTRAEVPIVLLGNPGAVRNLGGILLQQLQNLVVEALPMNVPSSVEVDVTGLEDFEMAVHVSDLSVGSNVTMISEPGELVARVSPPRIEVTAEEEAEEGAAAEEAPSGEAASEEDGAGS